MFLSIGLFPSISSATAFNPLGQIGTDVSWPNCKAVPPITLWGIVGVNDGLDFTVNPCAHKEANWFTHYGLYMNTGYPGINYAEKYSNFPLQCTDQNKSCLAYNYGYAAAAFSLRYSALESVHSNRWWLDVETVNSWSISVNQNRDALEGMVAAIKSQTLLTKVGFYSNKTQWLAITGGWQNKDPNWVATGALRSSEAQSACIGQNFTGGGTLMTQYTNTLDQEYFCQTEPINYFLNN